MSEAANSVLINLALAAGPVPAVNYAREPRVELLRAGLVHMTGHRLELTLDGMRVVLPLLAGMLGCAEVGQ